MWHGRRNGEDDASVESVLESVVNYADIVLWCDNCSGQNWTLFSSIFHFLSNNQCKLKTVTLKFFDKTYFN